MTQENLFQQMNTTLDESKKENRIQAVLYLRSSSNQHEFIEKQVKASEEFAIAYRGLCPIGYSSQLEVRINEHQT